MSFGAAKEFQTYARECVKLAGQENTPPELRDQLLKMAREWMHAAIDEEEMDEEEMDEEEMDEEVTARTLPRSFDESETAGDAAMPERERRSIVGIRLGEDRRSGRDRRSNAEQRSTGERRSKKERRSGAERRSTIAADASAMPSDPRKD